MVRALLLVAELGLLAQAVLSVKVENHGEGLMRDAVPLMLLTDKVLGAPVRCPVDRREGSRCDNQVAHSLVLAALRLRDVRLDFVVHCSFADAAAAELARRLDLLRLVLLLFQVLFRMLPVCKAAARIQILLDAFCRATDEVRRVMPLLHVKNSMEEQHQVSEGVR